MASGVMGGFGYCFAACCCLLLFVCCCLSFRCFWCIPLPAAACCV